MPNITLKRDAPFRGGFESLVFFRLRWLRSSSVTGAPLSSALGGAGTSRTGLRFVTKSLAQGET
jgi:hypothetical protein